MRELRSSQARSATASFPRVAFGPLLAALWTAFALATLVGRLLAG
jgi:hypothetical protein